MTAKKNDVLKTMDQNASARGVTLSNDPDLFFHTDAAEQISDQLGHAQGDRERLAKKIFEAIHAGEIDAYSMRDGSLLGQLDKKNPVAVCVRVHNVNAWLRQNEYSVIWTPVAIRKNGTSQRWTAEMRKELQSYRSTHTMRETSAYFRVSESRIRDLDPRKPPKATPFGRLGRLGK